MFKLCTDYNFYEISDTGVLKRKGEILNLKQNDTGNYYNITKNKKKIYAYIHYIVAKEHILNPNNYTKVIHIDGNIYNNNKSNLQWVPMDDNPQVGEIWKIVTGFDNYEVSNCGRLRNAKNKSVYKFNEDENGFYEKTFYKNNKATGIVIHHVVANEFIQNLKKYKIVSHKDGNKTNNHINNLEWVSKKSIIEKIQKKNNENKQVESLKGEIWKEINGFSNYKISNMARVQNITTKIILKHIERDYINVNLYNNKKLKRFAIHRLIATHFIDNPDNKKVVNHKNGNKFDNRIENLEWTTTSENIQHAHDNGLIKGSSLKVKIQKINSKTKQILQEWDSVSQALKELAIPNTIFSRYLRDKVIVDNVYFVRINPEVKTDNNPQEGEIWKESKLEPGYFVSNKGQVKNSKNKIMSQNNRTYKSVDIKSKKFCVHKLVADAFLPNPTNYIIVNHIDHNKFNNNLENLEWCDQKHNTNEAVKMGAIKTRQINQYDLKGNLIKQWKSATEACKELNLSRFSIWYNTTGKATSTKGGFVWKFPDEL